MTNSIHKLSNGKQTLIYKFLKGVFAFTFFSFLQHAYRMRNEDFYVW